MLPSIILSLRTRHELQIEIVALRPQCNVLRRSVPRRPRLLLGPDALGLAFPSLARLALCLGHRQTGDCDCLAPQGVSPVWDLQEQATLRRQTSSFERGSRADPKDEQRKLHLCGLGRSANPRGTWYRYSTGVQIYAATGQTTFSDMAEVFGKPLQGTCLHRFLYCAYVYLPYSLCFPRSGS